MRRALGAFLCCVLLSGCFTVRFRHGRLSPDGSPPQEQWHHGLVNGLFEVGRSVKVDEVCPNGVYAVENEVTLWNTLAEQVSGGLLVGGLTAAKVLPAPGTVPVTAAGAQYLVGRRLALWTPSTVRVFCARRAIKSLKLAILKLTAGSGVDQKLADLFTEGLVAELRRQSGVSVLTQSDMSALLGLERQKQLLGCTDESCLAELGGALGVDRLVHGSVGRVGSSLVIYLSSVDARRAQVVGSVSERLKSEEAWLDALPAIVSQLLKESAPQEPVAPAK